MHVLRWKRTHIHLFVLWFYCPPSFLTVYYGCLYNMFLFGNSVFLVPCRCFTSQLLFFLDCPLKLSQYLWFVIKQNLQSILIRMKLIAFIDIDICKVQLKSLGKNRDIIWTQTRFIEFYRLWTTMIFTF